MRGIEIEANAALEYHFRHFIIPELQSTLSKLKSKIDSIKNGLFPAKTRAQKNYLSDLITIGIELLKFKEDDKASITEILFFLTTIEKKISAYAETNKQFSGLFTKHYDQLMKSLNQFEISYKKKYPEKHEKCAYQDHIVLLKEKVYTLKDQLKNQNERLIKQEEIIHQQANKIKNTLNINLTAFQQIQSLTFQNNKLEKALESLKQENDVLKTKLSQEKSMIQIDTLKKEIDSLTQENNLLKTKNSQEKFTPQIDSLKKEVSSLKQEKDDLITSLIQTKKELLTQLSQLTEEVKSLRQRNDELEERFEITITPESDICRDLSFFSSKGNSNSQIINNYKSPANISTV